MMRHQEAWYPRGFTSRRSYLSIRPDCLKIAQSTKMTGCEAHYQMNNKFASQIGRIPTEGGVYCISESRYGDRHARTIHAETRRMNNRGNEGGRRSIRGRAGDASIAMEFFLTPRLRARAVRIVGEGDE